MFSKKATKFDKIFTVDLTLCSNCQIDGEDFVNFCGHLRKHELYQSCSFSEALFLQQLIQNKYILIRCLMVSTNQADPGCFYFRISWILMERRWFYFFHPLHFLQGLRSLKHWLLQKLSMKIFDQKFRFLIKNR